MFWMIASSVSFLLSIVIADYIQWPKFREYCKFIYLSKKYWLESNWVGLQTLMYEKRKNSQKRTFLHSLYLIGWRSIIFKDLIIYSRFSFRVWLMLLTQVVFAIYLMKSSEKSLFVIGCGIILLGITVNFANLFNKTIQKRKEGFLIPLTPEELLIGSLTLPVIISVLLLTIMVIVLNPIQIIIRIILVNITISILLPLLAVVRSYSNMGIMSFKFIFGSCLFIGYFFVAVHASLLYLCLFIFPIFLYNYILVKGVIKNYD
ncbi:hypothetical protein [Anoxybacter fermentans]|nr:hypothetical protein [Anoxybacter fermentans]